MLLYGCRDSIINKGELKVDFKMPHLATGQTVPGGTKSLEQQIKDAKAKQEKREQKRHDYFVAILSSICGGIAGFVASLIFEFCIKQ